VAPDLAACVFASLCLFAGYGVLRALGVGAAGLGEIAALAGLAGLAGMVTVALIVIALLTAGVDVGLTEFVAVAIVVGVAGQWAARRRSRWIIRPRGSLRGLARPSAGGLVALLS
jgi:hypothetical protein